MLLWLFWLFLDTILWLVYMLYYDFLFLHTILWLLLDFPIACPYLESRLTETCLMKEVSAASLVLLCRDRTHADIESFLCCRQSIKINWSNDKWHKSTTAQVCMFSSFRLFFSVQALEAVQLGRAMISHRAFYLPQYVDVINLGLWSEAGYWDIDTCLEFDVGLWWSPDNDKSITAVITLFVYKDVCMWFSAFAKLRFYGPCFKHSSYCN